MTVKNPRFWLGSILCEECDKITELKRKQDIGRKRFCSRSCRSRSAGRCPKPGTSAALRGRPKTAEHNMKNQLAHLGIRKTEEHKQLLSVAASEHASKDLPQCRCYAHRAGENVTSGLAWKTYDLLLTDFEIVIPEAQFDRYSVDFLLAEEWVGIEVDGKHWHDKHEQENPGCYQRRDEHLMKKFNLPIVRLQENELREMFNGSSIKK